MSNHSHESALIDGLQRDLSRKTYSFVEYITHASPYIAPAYEPLWKLLLRLRQQEREHANTISRLIVALGGIPNPMIMDESAADLNYLRLEYLGQLLVRHKEQSVREFEVRVEQAAGFPEIRAILLDILSAEESQLRELRETLEQCRAAASLSEQQSLEG